MKHTTAPYDVFSISLVDCKTDNSWNFIEPSRDEIDSIYDVIVYIANPMRRAQEKIDSASRHY